MKKLIYTLLFLASPIPCFFLAFYPLDWVGGGDPLGWFIGHYIVMPGSICLMNASVQIMFVSSRLKVWRMILRSLALSIAVSWIGILIFLSAVSVIGDCILIINISAIVSGLYIAVLRYNVHRL